MGVGDASCFSIKNHQPRENSVAGTMTRGRVRVEWGHKRVRACTCGGELVADTLSPLLVWEIPYYPGLLLPGVDVRAELVPTGTAEHSPSRGDAEDIDVRPSRPRPRGSGAALPQLANRGAARPGAARLGRHGRVVEEDEPIYVHPRDPYKRVDILASSRHVRRRGRRRDRRRLRQPAILFETGLPPRYYVPLTDVRMELLRPIVNPNPVPLQGHGHVLVAGRRRPEYEDCVWIYRSPLPESQKVAGLACFYNEKVDMYLDSVLQERPHTKFS